MTDKASILIVDDRPEKLLALEAVLEDLGQNIVRAFSGREALRQLLQQDFAVILLDVNMPGMDGFETAQLIRQRKSSEHVPIIFVTAFGDDIHAARGYQLGAVDYIEAPVVPEVLRTKVAVFVDLFRKTEQVKRQAESLR
ncbi:MAG TPA: response regulator, partial [Tepidisphaeraceae bacterium]|nr:response regulator [Tepidisphaeraceae bacterium]